MSKAKKYNIILLILCLVFFVGYSFLVLSTWLPNYLDLKHFIFNWPDANANYFFASLFASTDALFLFEPLNEITSNLIHTRSINVLDANLVPVTFLPALFLFGLSAKVLGSVGILFLSPLLAVLTGYLIYRLTYYIFKDLDIAFLTALLLLALAPWFYFANVVMLPTILFIFLVSLGFFCLANSLLKRDKNNFWWFCSTLVLSTAIVVRPTEIVWLTLLTIVVLYVKRHHLNFKRIFISFLVLATVVWLFLWGNNIVYGDYLSFGYLNLQSNTLSPEFNGHSGSFLDTIKLLIIPFGFDLALIAKNFVKYFLVIILYQVLFAGGGLILMLFNDRVKYAWKKYFLLTPFIFLIILLFYGSWNLADPLVKELNKISISYVRYFMPLYIWILPLAAYGLKKLFYSKNKVSKLALYTITAVIMISSIRFSFYSTYDGLFATQETLQEYYYQFKQVKEIVPQDSIIITERSDKLFFPYYKVIAPQGDLPLWSRVANLELPIYYYTTKSDTELLIDQNKANQVNLNMEKVGDIWHNFRLYKIINQ